MLRCGARASHCGGFSCCRARALGAWASVVVALGLSSCGLRAPEHRLEPVSPALAGRFSTTAPPGKPWVVFLILSCMLDIYMYLGYIQLDINPLLVISFVDIQ